MVSPRRPGANARTRRRRGHSRRPQNGQLPSPRGREVRAFFSQASDESASVKPSRFAQRLHSINFSSFAQRRWPLLLVVAGFLLLAYVGVQYLSMWHEQHVFAEEWTRQTEASSAAPVEVNGESGVARLIVPRLGLDQVVIEGTSYKALKAGPGHLANTPLPGDPGNAVLAGHRDTFFRKLDDLATGDSVVIERGGHTYRFAVAGRKIVDPGDVTVLKATSEPTLTLITCYPPHVIGPAPKRLVLTANLAPDSSATAPGH